jgi:hypothetical protein
LDGLTWNPPFPRVEDDDAASIVATTTNLTPSAPARFDLDQADGRAVAFPCRSALVHCPRSAHPEGNDMKYFLIKYRLQNVSPEAWHKEVAEFIAALDSDPALKGKISYRCMKTRAGADYYHLAAAADEQAVKALQSSPSFSRYTEKIKQVAGGEVEVLPLDIVAETALKA